MFIQALVYALIIGLLLKGDIKKLNDLHFKKINLIFIAFIIEFLIVMSIKNGIITSSYYTYFINLIMYILIFIFIYENRENPWMVMMGVGFLLNAIAIFSNGGAMPVGQYAIDTAKLTNNVTAEGLYVLVDESTRMWFLGDVIPLTFPRKFAISIGDIVSAIGLMLLIITAMKPKIFKKALNN